MRPFYRVREVKCICHIWMQAGELFGEFANVDLNEDHRLDGKFVIKNYSARFPIGICDNLLQTAESLKNMK